MVQLLLDAQQAIALAKLVGIGGLDPRIALALDLVSQTLQVVSPLLQAGVVYPLAPIEIDDVGLALLASLKRQLDELA
jgi:hypothetical protein